jgi:GGDEF domain-containing protein
LSVYPDDGLDAETLIKNADAAMAYAKEKAVKATNFSSQP